MECSPDIKLVNQGEKYVCMCSLIEKKLVGVNFWEEGRETFSPRFGVQTSSKNLSLWREQRETSLKKKVVSSTFSLSSDSQHGKGSRFMVTTSDLRGLHREMHQWNGEVDAVNCHC